MDAVESYRERAPRLRLAALVVVGLVVVGLIVFAVIRANPSVTGGLVVRGHLCVPLDNQVWHSVEPFEPDQSGPFAQGSWTSTGDRTATFTTPSGRVVEMATTMDPVGVTSKPRGWMMRPCSWPISISLRAAARSLSTMKTVCPRRSKT